MISIVEIGLRLRMGPPPPAVQVYSRAKITGSWFEESNGLVRPRYQGLFGIEDFSKTWGPEGSVGNHPRSHRFAVLGGSTVHGGTPDLPTEREFPALLGQKIGARGVNLGNPGLDSHDILKIVDELRAYRMDAWVLYTGHNDFGNGYFLQRYRGWPGGLQAHARSLLEGLQLFWQIRRLGQLAITHGTEPNADHQFTAPGIGPAQKSHILMDYLRNIRRIIWIAEQAEVPLVLVVPAGALLMPPVGRCQEGEARKLWMRGIAQKAKQNPEARSSLMGARDADCIPLRMLGEAQDGLRALAQPPQVRLVDAPRDLPREPGLDVSASSIFMDHIHLTKAGHQTLADLIAPTLREALFKSASD
jgi:lysophospholipase L1-like esterase